MVLLRRVSFTWVLLFLAVSLAGAAEQTNVVSSAPDTNAPAWLTRPLSLSEALNIALRQNSSILRSRTDIEATYGVAIQTRAIAIPKLVGGAAYDYNEAIEPFSFDVPPGLTGGEPIQGISPGQNRWNGNIRVVQSIYEGGRIRSALRTAKLFKEVALLQYDAVVSDTLFEVRRAYYDVLFAEQDITAQEALVALLEEELRYVNSRAGAGVVTKFNVLRAEVALANAKPRLIRARNAHRIAKNSLANVLGYRIPPNVWEDIPMVLTDQTQAEPFDLDLPAALVRALQNRPELATLNKTEKLRREDIIRAKAGYKPSVGVFGGYNARSPNLTDDFWGDVSGWMAGVQLDWYLFDGNLTRGRVKEAEARLEGARVNLDDTSRRVELEVRTAYSQFVEAREVLQTQEKVIEQALEAVRLAQSRWKEGVGTQLDVLDAQTSLTDARTIQAMALRDYAVARARLERAIGTIFEKSPAR